MTTSKPSPPGGSPSPDPGSTWSAPGSPASPSPTPAAAKPKRTRGGSGRRLPDAFAHYDPGSCCWKTLQGSLAGEWARFSGTWPRSGTTRNGTAYRRPRWVPRTFAAGSSSSPTPTAPAWPTPTVSRSRNRTASRKAGSRHHDGITLLDAVRLWPTPTAADGERTSTSYPRGNPTLAGGELAGPQGEGTRQGPQRQRDRHAAGGRGPAVADAGGAGRQGPLAGIADGRPRAARCRDEPATRDAAEPGVGGGPDGLPAGVDRPTDPRRWPAPPGQPPQGWEPFRTIAGRQPGRTARLSRLGNAVVPQVGAVIGRWALATLHQHDQHDAAAGGMKAPGRWPA